MTRNLTVLAIAFVMFLSVGSLLSVHAAATISADKKDYSPGETVKISGTSFDPSTSITISVTRPDASVESCTGINGWRFSSYPSCNLQSDSSGSFAEFYSLDGIVGSYSVTATDGTNTATTNFTDALSTDWTQCENDHDHDGAIDAGGVCFWTGGNLDLQHNLLAEGNTLPNVPPSAGAPSGQYTSASNAPGHSNQRAIIQSVPDGSLRLRIRYEFTKGGVKAYDFLTTNYGITDSNLCTQPDGITAASCASIVSAGPKRLGFPTDTTTVIGGKTGDIEDRQTAHDTAFLTGAGGKTALPASEVRKMKIYGLGTGSITSIVNVGLSGSPTGNSDYSVDIFFTKTTGAPSSIIATFGAHFAISSVPPAGWGTGNGAGSISGSPFHVIFDGLFQKTVPENQLSGGNRANQVSVSTVLGVTVSCSPSKGTTGKPVSCTATANGGQSPFTFAWTAPGGTPSSGTGSTFSTTYGAPGTYTITVTVTDSRGVSATSSIMFVVNFQPKTLSMSCSTSATAGKPVTCTATSTGGGAAGATFSWSAPSGSPSTGTGSSFTTAYGTPGTYTITVTQHDSDGFTTSQSASVTVSTQPKTLNVSCGTATAGKPVTCTASSTGGIAPITFSWSAPGGVPSTGTGSSFTTTYAAKGNYTISVTQHDGDGLTITSSKVVTITPQPLVVTVTCPTSGVTTGKPFNCTVSASGGTSPYSGTGTFSRTESTKGTKTETFTVTDSNQVSASGSATVTVAGQPLVVTVTCDSGATAGKPFNCTVSAMGGTSPYTGTGTFSRTEPTKGTKTETFTVTDSNTVSASGSATVIVAPQPLVVTVTCPSSGVTAGKPFSCTVSATGGTAPYSGTGTFSRTEPTKGSKTETFSVTDSNTVTASGSATVSVAPQPLVVTVICSDGTAGKPLDCNVSATGGTTAYTGTGSFSRTFATKGTYNACFDVTDANGVTATGCDTVTVAPQPLVVTVDCGSGQTAGKPFTCVVSATGGTTAYSGTGTFTLTQPVKGTFDECFTVTDANRASSSGCDTVTVAPQPLVVTVDCGTGQTAGKPFSCTVAATGGTGPYSGTGSFSRTEPTKGTFTETFTVTDANHVSATGSATVAVAPQPLVVTVDCGTGQTAGKPFNCTVTATGGTTAYSGTGTFTKTEPVKGSFDECFTVTDANTASASGCDTVIIAPQPLVVTVVCSDGTAGKPVKCDVSASGGTTSYSGTGSFTRSFPVKGSYNVCFDVTDSNHVTATGCDSVAISPQPLVVTVVCSDGTAGKPVKCDVSASGGTESYIGTGSFTRTFPVKGTYDVCFEVTDANGVTARGCDSVTIDPQPLVITAVCTNGTAGKPIQCDSSATGGTEPYTFLWDVGKNGTVDGQGQKFQPAFPVKGQYSIDAIVVDANGIRAFVNLPVTITPQELVITASCVEGGTAGKPVNCTASASGGTTPYVFTWDIGKDGRVDAEGSKVNLVFPVKGTFSIDARVTDANGATAFVNFPIRIGPQPLTIFPSSTLPHGSAPAIGFCDSGGTAGKPVSCTASANGGTAPYRFTWDIGKDGTIDAEGANVSLVFPVKGTFSVDLNVTDANMFSTVINFPVTIDPQPLVISASCSDATAGKPVYCSASASGGTTPYTFLWDIGKDGTIDGQGEQFTTSFAVKGPYSIDAIVIDGNHARAFVNLPVRITPQPLVITASCQPGTAGKPTDCNASASGGTTPYTFTWDIGKDGTPDGDGQSFTTVFPVKGTYSIDAIVVDANQARAFVNLPITVRPQPLVLTATCPSGTTGKPVTCDASATGGTGPYEFDWSVGGGQPNSGNGPSFTTTFTVKNTYTVVAGVTDANGASASLDVDVVIAPQPLVITARCSPGTAGKPTDCHASASGGTEPYTFTWDIGKDGRADGQGASFTTVFPVKGSYSIDAAVVDANGARAFVNLSFRVEPQPLVITASCQPGTAGKPTNCSASAAGGTEPYSFSWDVGKDGTADALGSGFTTVFPVKGTYSIDAIVVDANQARAFVNLPVVVQPQPLVITAQCLPGTAGKPTYCSAIVSGGTEPYAFTWDVGKDGSADGQDLSFTTVFAVKGTYSIDAKVTDANGATAFVNLPIVVGPQPLVVTATCPTSGVTAGKPFTCTVSATGGTSPYSGTGTFTITEPVKGTFTERFTVTDSNHVSATASASVTVAPQPLVVTVTCPSSGVTAGKPFNCTVSATGGTAPYTGTGTFTRTEPTKGTRTETFSVTDGNGVTASASATVTVAPQPLVVTVTCPSSGVTAGKPFSCTVSATGGTGPYSGTGTITRTEATKGSRTETFNVTDSNRVSTLGSATVNVSPQPLVVTVTCPTSGVTAGKPFNCTVRAVGGTAPYTGTGTFTRTEPTKGSKTETFSVTDSNGVTASGSATVTVAPQPLVADWTSVCSGGTNVFTATVSGGTTPYSFSWNFGDGNTGTGNPVSHFYGSSSSFTVTLTVTDANGATVRVTHSANGCGVPVVVTDTSFCTLPNNNFVLIFVQDPANPSAYRLVASNPGQFYDNVFYSAAAGSPVSLNIQIPYPFVTHGAFPIQVSSSFTVNSKGCFVPSFDNPSGFTITAPGPLSSSGHPTIVLSNYSPQNFGSFVTVTVTGTVPSTGLVYVTIHLDYGLKGTSGWTKGVAQGSSFQAVNSGLGLTLNNGQSYTFSVSGSESFTTSVTSTNVFKKDPGFAGVVTDSADNPLPGVRVSIYYGDCTVSCRLLGIVYTDKDGFYAYQYKYTGSEQAFTVRLPDYRDGGKVIQAVVLVKSNRLVLQSFQLAI